MKEVIGREVGRYLIGALPLEGHDFSSHPHSVNAIRALKENKIGYLNYGDSNILEVKGTDNTSQSSKIKLRLFTPFKVNKLIIRNEYEGRILRYYHYS